MLIRLLLLLLVAQQSVAGDIVLENKSFKYVISSTGKNLEFTDKATSTNYLAGELSYCAQVLVQGKTYPADLVMLNENLLRIVFKEANVAATIGIKKRDHSLVLEVLEVTGDYTSLTFLNIPLTLQGLPTEAFGACALSLHLNTQVKQLPAMQSHLWAACYKELGTGGSAVALIGVSPNRMLPEIRQLVQAAPGLVLSKAGGAWADSSAQSSGSYIMNFGTLNEQSIEQWIADCRNVGFNQIDHHGGASGFFRFGDFELDPANWPEGWNHFTRINERLQQAGISSIFHTYAFFVEKTSKYVTPVPSKDLLAFRSFTLKKPIAASDSSIEIEENPAGISLFTGFHVRNSVTLRIGDELIEFSGITTEPPYRFTGCKRGANGTKISAHLVSDTAYHLKELFGMFVPGPDTELFEKIAVNTAEIVNNHGFDAIYLDAIDGADVLGDPALNWYYASKFVFTIAKHLKRPTGMEMSLMTHHFWNFRSRWQAWDVSRRGHKKFVDIHLKEINKGLMLPLNLGWWLNFTWDPPQTEHSFTDDVEYLGTRQIAYNAGLSLLGGYEHDVVKKTPSFARLNAIIKNYEELRQANYFSEKTKQILRTPGMEFTLLKDNKGKWNFKPAFYKKHKLSGYDSASHNWVVQNSFKAQPLKLRIHMLNSVTAYNHPTAKTLTSYSTPGFFEETAAAPGVSGSLAPVDDSIGKVRFAASSNGSSPQTGSWIKMHKKFNNWMDLSKHQALGFWVKGDGKGQLLNLRLESPYHLSTGAKGDHFVTVDFTGWKYFELVELSSGEASEYTWPDYNPYQSHMFSLDYSKIESLQLWYNGLPAKKEVTTVISDIRALPLTVGKITNPSIVVKGKKITFPVTMESGMYLEYNSMDDCILYDSKGAILAHVKPLGETPVLSKGDNKISFSCQRVAEESPRLDITIIGHGAFIN